MNREIKNLFFLLRCHIYGNAFLSVHFETENNNNNPRYVAVWLISCLIKGSWLLSQNLTGGINIEMHLCYVQLVPDINNQIYNSVHASEHMLTSQLPSTVIFTMMNMDGSDFDETHEQLSVRSKMCPLMQFPKIKEQHGLI